LRIREISHYRVETEDGKPIRVGLKDLEDAYEHAVNYLLENPKADKAIIKAEIIVKIRR